LKDLLFTPDALLMGRKDIPIFRSDLADAERGRGGQINRMPKYVASRSLKAPLAWNATLLDGDTAKEIAKLKEQPGRDLLQYGVGQLTQTLLRHNLVDEFRLVVFPFVFGRGPRIFETFDAMSLRSWRRSALAPALSLFITSRNKRDRHRPINFMAEFELLSVDENAKCGKRRRRGTSCRFPGTSFDVLIERAIERARTRSRS
jgi:dihydrofolate reductase